MHSHQPPSLLRADDHASDLVELGVAFATNRRAKVVSTAARLFVAVTVGEPFAAGVVHLGLDLVFGKWLSRIDDPAVMQLTDGSGAADVAEALEPYFQHGQHSARKTVEEPGNLATITMAHLLQANGRHGEAAYSLHATELQADRPPTLLRPEQHANALSELADAFASNRRAKIVNMAAKLFVSAIVAEPFTAAVVNLGLDLVFGKWLSRLDDRAVEQMKENPRPDGVARTLEPYFRHASDSARKTVHEPGGNPALTMAQHLEADTVRGEAPQKETVGAIETAWPKPRPTKGDAVHAPAPHPVAKSWRPVPGDARAPRAGMLNVHERRTPAPTSGTLTQPEDTPQPSQTRTRA